MQEIRVEETPTSGVGTRPALRGAGCLLASLLAACAGVPTVAPQGSVTQAPAPQAALTQASPSQGDPSLYHPAGAWSAPAAPAVSNPAPDSIVTSQADPARQSEPAQEPALDEPADPAQEASGVEATPAMSLLPIAAAEEAPNTAPEPTPVTANLPARPASAPTRALGSLVAIAPPRSNLAPAPVAKAPEPSFDVTALKLRLRETPGIGVFGKLALKRELDDLIQRLRGHHEMGQTGGVALLRAPYNSLVQKLLAALHVGDPDLAHLVLASREAIWAILSDPLKFFATN